MAFTRRTHVVRIKDPDGDKFLDVEVLDAISYRGANNEENILDLAASNAAPFIVDNVGGEHAKAPGEPTRRSHMKRVVNRSDSTQKIDVEVLDVIAFHDANGEQWILDMSKTSSAPDAFSLTDDTGSSQSTRRTHTEKLAIDPKEKSPTQYVSVERCDAMAFRSINGEEMILSNPSSDDPRSSAPRASTHVTPSGYNATDSGPTPPDNKDPSVYFAFVKGANGCFTNAELLQPGPLWWIRRVGGSPVVIMPIRIVWEVAGTARPTDYTLGSFSWLDTAPAIDVGISGGYLQTDGLDAGEYENPIPAKLLAHAYMWNAPPVFTPFTLSGAPDPYLRGSFLFFMNVGKVRAKVASENGGSYAGKKASFIFHTTDGKKVLKPTGGTVYYVWIDGYPFPAVPGEPSGNYAQYDNAAGALSYINDINSIPRTQTDSEGHTIHVELPFVHLEIGGVTGNEEIVPPVHWEIEAATYGRTRNFVRDPVLNNITVPEHLAKPLEFPLFDLETLSHDNLRGAFVVAPKSVTVEVDLSTLDITISVTPALETLPITPG